MLLWVTALAGCLNIAEDAICILRSVESRTSFSMWLCEQHNIVNRKIHKPMFKCTMENLEERWRKGKPSCWGEDGDEDSTQDTLM
ncbi:hypothetical protein KXD40_001314 [Peronospora effusa]|uniref:Sulfhydryl oxidase n=1 Tax=Peronospora effusa TaxID=542832 RepID=A0A3M6VTY2_9STRA|nr:hypothetical protein DD238_000330 [Peronospora effusa]UIZ20895.1 hypothetical protein KXD40_001314 [Peronospora effusa]